MSTAMDDTYWTAWKLLRELGLFDDDHQPTAAFFSLIRTANAALRRRHLYSQEGFDAVDHIVLKIAQEGRAAYPDWPEDGYYIPWLRKKVLNHIQTMSRNHDVTKKSDKDTQMENTLVSPDETPSTVAAQQYLEHFERYIKARPDSKLLLAILRCVHLTKDRQKMAAQLGISERSLTVALKIFARAIKQFVQLFGAFDKE